MTDLPTVVTAAGLQPQSPLVIRENLTTAVAAVNPGYTNDLPGGLIEDIASTDVAAIAQADAARVDTVNSLTPFGINAFLLPQLGAQFGVPIGQASNTSVFVVFTGTPGYVISKGFVVTDGTYQYIVSDGGIVGADRGDGLGVSPQIFCVASQKGTWAVPAQTVRGLVTSVPGTITLTVNNSIAGIPSESAQTEESYRAQLWQAGLASAQGMTTMLKTQLNKVSGVQARLVSVKQAPNNGGWEVICGGGDPYQVGYAISYALFDINTLIGSSMTISAITKAANAQITTTLNHGYVVGQAVQANGVLGMTQINGVATTVVAVIDQKTFTVAINSTGFSTYTSGGVMTPNARNIVVSIIDYPDTYNIPYVNPPQQSVTVSLVWNTSSVNFVSGTAIAQAGAPALANYINNIVVGQPINVFEMQNVFQAAIADILDPNLLTRMIFSVSINGISTAPTAGTGIIAGDPESYFLTTSANITITQG